MTVRQVMRVFSILLLILVGAVFVVTPSGLIASMTPGWMDARFWAVAIFIYYILATMLPVDKLIGNLYPLFGGRSSLYGRGADVHPLLRRRHHP